MIAFALSLLLGAAPPATPAGTRSAERELHEREVLVLDLNQASVEELTRLPGVGPKRAEAIIARRKARPFTRVTQLLEVKGIGRKTLERLKPHVRIVPLVPLGMVGSPAVAPKT